MTDNMTIGQAIKALKSLELQLASENFSKALVVAIEALEKQMPRKPIPFKESWSDEIFYKCPVCGDSWNMNEFGNGMECCWTCGQKIDWESDTE